MAVDEPASPDVVKKPLFAIFTMLGGVLILLGPFLPWATRPLPYGQTDSFNGFLSNWAPDAIAFLVAGGVITVIGAGRQWATPPVWVQRLPVVVAGLAGWLAGYDITLILQKILPQFPYSYVGTGWYVLYMGVGFAALGALAVDRKPLPPLRPLAVRSHFDETDDSDGAVEFHDTSRPIDWVALAKVLAALGGVLAVISFIGEAMVGGWILFVIVETIALVMWLVGRRRTQRI